MLVIDPLDLEHTGDVDHEMTVAESSDHSPGRGRNAYSAAGTGATQHYGEISPA